MGIDDAGAMVQAEVKDNTRVGSPEVRGAIRKHFVSNPAITPAGDNDRGSFCFWHGSNSFSSNFMAWHQTLLEQANEQTSERLRRGDARFRQSAHCVGKDHIQRVIIAAEQASDPLWNTLSR